MSESGSENNPQHGEDQGGGIPAAPVPSPVAVSLNLFIDELCRYRDALVAADPNGNDQGENEYVYLEVFLAKSHRGEEIDVCIHSATGYIRIRRSKAESRDRPGAPGSSTPRFVLTVC